MRAVAGGTPHPGLPRVGTSRGLSLVWAGREGWAVRERLGACQGHGDPEAESPPGRQRAVSLPVLEGSWKALLKIGCYLEPLLKSSV